MNPWNNENYHIAVGAIQPAPAVVENGPIVNPPAPPAPLIGPVMPNNIDVGSRNNTAEADSQGENVTSSQNQRRSRSRDRSSRRDRDRSTTDHTRNRNRSRDRNDGHRRERRRDSRERRTKWGDPDRNAIAFGGQHISGMPMGNVILPGMMQFPNLANMMGHQPVDGQLPLLSAMNVPGMLPMMDQNMMIINQQMLPLVHQQIYTSGGIFLPPIQGVATPTRRARPKGCRTIFVGGLPHNITEETLNEIFQRFGNMLEIKSPRRGVFHVRFDKQESVEQSFAISGYRFRFHDQIDSEATTMFIDYALNREDQNEFERSLRNRGPSPHRIEPFTQSNLASVTEKIKNEEEFSNVAHTLAAWLERGECNKRNANTFYSLIQASNNQVRRLFNEKMQLDEELLNLKTGMKDKFIAVLSQFEQVAKILSAAKHQRVSDHFTKQQRRNIDMWMKMTEELANMKEEYNATFEDDEVERPSKNMVSQEKYEELKQENENLTYELEGYKNEAYLAKDEAERKFEKFKAHYIAQQALQNKQTFSPFMASTSKRVETMTSEPKLSISSAILDDNKILTTGPSVASSEAKLISLLTAFLMVHPLGASLDYLVSYVKSMTPLVTQATVLATLEKYDDVFQCTTSGVGASIEHRWGFVTFDSIKREI